MASSTILIIPRRSILFGGNLKKQTNLTDKYSHEVLLHTLLTICENRIQDVSGDRH